MPAQLDRAYVATRPTKALERLCAAALFEGRPLTARGRWLNPLVAAVLASARALPQLARVRAPIYVVGSGRSGTTWLAKVLSLQREVGFLNEPKALWQRAIPGEDLIGSYTRAPGRLLLTAEDASPRARRTLERGYGAFLALTRSTRLLDKYPELVFRIDCVRALFPDARFLFLARSGADACRSVAAWSAAHATQRGRETHDWWGRARRKWELLVREGAAREPDLAGAGETLLALTEPRDMAALEWTLAMRAGLAAAERYPEQVRLVRYEELARGPRAVVSEILAFAGLAPDERVLAYAERSAVARDPGAPLELAPALQAPFQSTLRALGYSA